MDFIRDRSGRYLLRVHNLVAPPDYVKQSAVSEECVADLAPGQFADPERRLFPLDTAGHVYLSHAYCKLAGVTDERLLRRIKRAAELLRIQADLEEFDKKADADFEKAAAAGPQRKFALAVDFGPGQAEATHPLIKQGGVHGFFPINHPDEVLASAQALQNQRELLPMAQYVKAARNIVKAASNKAALPPAIVTYGEERVTDLGLLQQQAEKRAAVTGDNTYLELVTAFNADPDKDEWDKWAALWEQADSVNKFASDKLTLNAWLIFNSGVLKSAIDKAAENWLLVAGTPVPVSAVAAVPELRVRSWLAKSDADQVDSIRKAAASGAVSGLQERILQLPATVQSLLARMAADTPASAAA